MTSFLSVLRTIIFVVLGYRCNVQVLAAHENIYQKAQVGLRRHLFIFSHIVEFAECTL